MQLQKFFCLLLFTILFVTSCREHVDNPYRDVSMDDFVAVADDAYQVSARLVKRQIEEMVRQDSDTLTADYRARSHYLKGGRWVWIGRRGVSAQADTLLHYLKQVGEMGFSPGKFRVREIEEDLQRIRALDLDTLHRMSRTMGRLEYNLTKAYLRYAVGQRYGYINPKDIVNRLDVVDTAVVPRAYRGLCDIPMQLPSSGYYEYVLNKVAADSVGGYLRGVRPTHPLYARYQEMLSRPGLGAAARDRILANMERCRWRLNEYPHQYQKYVLVNIPAFHLRAVDGEEVLELRIGCGTKETKTPLLTSAIKRMDVNPQWIIPKSIVKQSVVRHVGDSAYFASHHYFVRERKSGKIVPPSAMTAAMLLSPDYMVAQEGGEGNSLGRIIFRFDNAFSVYLHDTSSRDFFARANRGVSHGCVRVEKPFDLALFLMADKSSPDVERIRYSMTADVSMLGKAGRRGEGVPDTLNRRKLISTLKVEPRIPLFITYYTLYPDPSGKMEEFADVYGYDRVIYQYLNNYR